MISEILNMNGYGLYVWSSFMFTLLSFGTLYFVTKIQLIKELRDFEAKFKNLDIEKAEIAKITDKFKELKSLVYNYKDLKEKEILELSKNLIFTSLHI